MFLLSGIFHTWCNIISLFIWKNYGPKKHLIFNFDELVKSIEPYSYILYVYVAYKMFLYILLIFLKFVSFCFCLILFTNKTPGSSAPWIRRS